ncbi:MAG TPA: GNAT family N-acetyltransferase [Flavitalea sp.]|nr:GNAT family N-acetyltransferase [Flavitalea sp.]
MQQVEPVWKQRPMVIETRRLTIFPLSKKEMRLYIQPGNELETALGLSTGSRSITPELTDALKHSIIPAIEHGYSRLEFVTLWTMIDRENNVMVGDLCFKGGPGHKDDVEIGYGTYPAFRGKGYMSEALAALSVWALNCPEVRVVLAETKTENAASQQVLTKAGFQQYKAERGMIFWKKEATRNR